MPKLTKLEQYLLQGKKIGIYVQETQCTPYASLMAHGLKILETRKKDTLKHLVGHDVYIIRRYHGMCRVIGTVYIESGMKLSYNQFRDAYHFHFVPYGSKYDCEKDGFKWCYILRNHHIVDSSKYTYKKVTQTYAIITEVQK